MNSLGFPMNSLAFFNEFTRIPKWVHKNSSTNSLKIINKFIWIHPQIQLNLSTDSFDCKNFLDIHHFSYIQHFLFFEFIDKIIYEFTDEFIESNLIIFCDTDRQIKKDRSSRLREWKFVHQFIIFYIQQYMFFNSSIIWWTGCNIWWIGVHHMMDRGTSNDG